MTQSEQFPKISIITPSYNQGGFLERTIRSVLDQNYPNIEFIIVDGGSTDDSVEVIKKYEDRITYWVSEKDKGTYEANNKGLAKVTGDYWCVVNSDDVLLPNAISTVVEAIKKNPNQKWFAGGVNRIDENDVVMSSWAPTRPADSIEGLTFIFGCWTPHPAVFLHKDLIKEIGYFEKYHSMDLNYWLRLNKAGYDPYIIHQNLAGLRYHLDCKTMNLVKAKEEEIKVLKDFIISENLTNNKKISSILNGHKIELNKLKMSYAIVDNQNSLSGLLVETFRLNPMVVFKKWYLGMIKRKIVGLDKSDQLFEEYNKANNNKANWNDL